MATHAITIEVETCIFEGVELIGVYGIKQLANVSSAAVCNWGSRFDDFPVPAIDLGATPNDARGAIRLWRFDEITKWLVTHKKLPLGIAS